MHKSEFIHLLNFLFEISNVDTRLNAIVSDHFLILQVLKLKNIDPSITFYINLLNFLIT
ncbi:hypothetical protein A33Q_1748 [Indibacter alkaliphilus LW1]|uniref:Uncharacterized protein n=1 Tax=Indibacter alkaliphilus (strain CCUG 57479 / KCTC 22604 / LW1) TaxID=1189612 RepID=S2DE62_INDAL|nr:hypothetical protein A33Q_1748 [Indibacter alkaliphilus LW1]